MASGLVERSPLEFDYVGQQPRGGTSRPSPPPKTFLVKIVEKPDYTHRTHIRESLIYGRWPEREDVYHLFSDHALSKNLLSQAVPPGMAHAGLVDWESFDQLDDEEKLSASLTSKTDFVRARERRRKSESKLYSLVQAYNARLAGSEQAQEGGGLLRAAEPMDDAADLQDNPLARVNSTEEESLKPAVRDAS
ncbi:uncharacterized protein THITE_2106476 [Thermothielavioides terrestris NRRL 8126]|uniref:Uncharacterized protein n=2 Tax=Thermothielavioides terrestris TaxID=2587410 RepID=G2QXQ6_THETT|nr:uncharacterized protein THITE_2106476 [Thermothielavioides terrestris NRRL 8126]AEO62374.1 hypothetical protein THITE_2106476 [Thermothielavioides terrestris NRRL 8126]